MAKLNYKNGVTSVVLRVKLHDSAVTTGAGKTGLTHSSTGLIISTIADNEATATAYTQASGNIETISTLGTFATPTSGKCRFKEIDATNHPGDYEIQIANARWAVSGARSLLVTISGVSGVAQCDAEIQLEPVPADVTHALGTALSGPLMDSAAVQAANAAALTAYGVPTLTQLNRLVRGFSTVTYIGTGDDCEAVIEGGSAGTLFIFAPGAHTADSSIAVPANCGIIGAGRDVTTISGNPGSGTAGVLSFAGNGWLQDISVVATTQGTGVRNAASSSCAMTWRNVRIQGLDDAIFLYHSTSQINSLFADNFIFECATQPAHDALALVDASWDIKLRNGMIRTSRYGIYATMVSAGRHATIDCDGVNFIQRDTSDDQFSLFAANTFAANILDASFRGCTFNGKSSAYKAVNITCSNGAVATVRDLGGNSPNFVSSNMTLSGATFLPYTTDTLNTIDSVADTAAASAGTAATQSTNAASQTTAANLRTAVGLASANLDTQLTDKPNAAGIRTALGMATNNLDTQLAAKASQASLDIMDAIADSIKAVTDKLDDTLEDNGGTYRFTEPALEEAPSGGGGGGGTVTADRVPKQLTFFVGSEGNVSRNIVTLNAWSSGTRTLAFDLSELLDQSETRVADLDSVTVVQADGSPTITTSNLREHQEGKIVLWDVAAISAANAGRYTVTVTVDTVDSNRIVVKGTLEVE